MKNQREIYEALLAGETLIYRSHPINRYVRMENGFITDDNGGDVSATSFYDSENWRIYKEPKWYENIPDGGVLVIDEDENVYEMNNPEEYDVNVCLKPPRPLTKQEIKVFMDNAPEELL